MCNIEREVFMDKRKAFCTGRGMLRVRELYVHMYNEYTLLVFSHY